MTTIVTIDHPDHQVLLNNAKPVPLPLNEEFRGYIARLEEAIKSLESPYGKPAGLAAPQIGIPYQIICFQIPEEAKERRKDVFDTYPLTFWINPTYTPIEEEGFAIDREACYSVPNQWNDAKRYFAIRVEAYTPTMEKIVVDARGFLARVLQHEIDHLKGIMCTSCFPEGGQRGPLEDLTNSSK